MERDKFGRFVKGFEPWNKGKKLSKEMKEKIKLRTIEGMKKLDKETKKRIKNSQFKLGKEHIGWKGGKNRYYYRIARKIMEDHLGKKLKENETIHHINGNFKNNNIENLGLFINHSEHLKFHWKRQKEKEIPGRIIKFMEILK